MEAFKRSTKKTIIGILGGIVVLLGVVMIPYPGPGWLTVFAGLAILATEFNWAREILDFGREAYDRWQKWLKSRHISIRAFFWTLTAIVVVATIWLLNGYGLLNTWFDFGWGWLTSPLPIFN